MRNKANTKEIITVAEVLNQLIHIKFSFDFLGLEKVYFENKLVNQLTK